MTFQAIVHLTVFLSWGWWLAGSLTPVTSVSATCFLLLHRYEIRGSQWSPCFLWPSLAVLLSSTRTNPSQNRFRKFCVGLPQPVCTLACSVDYNIRWFLCWGSVRRSFNIFGTNFDVQLVAQAESQLFRIFLWCSWNPRDFKHWAAAILLKFVDGSMCSFNCYLCPGRLVWRSSCRFLLWGRRCLPWDYLL